ncbi:MAG: hypothetical protein ABWY63_14235 [Hyphomicrobiaceae bacterium]
MTMMREATDQQWDDYLTMVKQQMALIDLLTPENKQLIWDCGYDAVIVRRMLAAQKKAAREVSGRSR